MNSQNVNPRAGRLGRAGGPWALAGYPWRSRSRSSLRPMIQNAAETPTTVPMPAMATPIAVRATLPHARAAMAMPIAMRIRLAMNPRMLLA